MSKHSDGEHGAEVVVDEAAADELMRHVTGHLSGYGIESKLCRAYLALTAKLEAAEARAKRLEKALDAFASDCDELARNCGPEITKAERRTWEAMAKKLRSAALGAP